MNKKEISKINEFSLDAMENSLKLQKMGNYLYAINSSFLKQDKSGIIEISKKGRDWVSNDNQFAKLNVYFNEMPNAMVSYIEQNKNITNDQKSEIPIDLKSMIKNSEVEAGICYSMHLSSLKLHNILDAAIEKAKAYLKKKNDITAKGMHGPYDDLSKFKFFSDSKKDLDATNLQINKITNMFEKLFDKIYDNARG